MHPLLIIAGQTATGKTSFAVEIAKKFNGELISADSRQVYRGMDIVTGKDKDKINVPIWLYDLVSPDDSFSVSKWRQKALEAIDNISTRGKLPIVVGGTGLYLRSLTESLDSVNIPPDHKLRNKLSKLSVSDLFDQLTQLDQSRANSLNNSDRHNPHRLVRHIEIALNKKEQHPPLESRGGLRGRYLSVVLTCNPDILKKRIEERVKERIESGAILELQNLASTFNLQSSSFSACGYRSLLKSNNPEDWIRSEYQYARRQKVFFQKYFPKNTVDITDPMWHTKLVDIISTWTNT